MKEYLDSHIKPLLEAHPALGGVLESAGIGCTACSLGTCRIRDILEIHNLDTLQVRVLLTRMGEVLHPGRAFEVPVLERQALPSKGSFCPPIARMVHEHGNILRFLDLIPALTRLLERDPEAGLVLLERGLDFIRNYADRYHHAKEEDILFRFFEPGSEILQVMLEDHTHGREHVAEMAAGIQEKDPLRVAFHLRAYGELLRGHIQREDTILYPWMDRTLTLRQVGELFTRCAEVEARLGPGAQAEEAFLADLSARMMVAVPEA